MLVMKQLLRVCLIVAIQTPEQHTSETSTMRTPLEPSLIVLFVWRCPYFEGFIRTHVNARVPTGAEQWCPVQGGS